MYVSPLTKSRKNFLGKNWHYISKKFFGQKFFIIKDMCEGAHLKSIKANLPVRKNFCRVSGDLSLRRGIVFPTLPKPKRLENGFPGDRPKIAEGSIPLGTLKFFRLVENFSKSRMLNFFGRHPPYRLVHRPLRSPKRLENGSPVSRPRITGGPIPLLSLGKALKF